MSDGVTRLVSGPEWRARAEEAESLLEAAAKVIVARTATIERIKDLKGRWQAEPGAGRWCVCLGELEAVLKEVKG